MIFVILLLTLGFICFPKCFRFKVRPFVGVPIMVQWLTNPTRNREVAGSVPALAQWVDDLALL